MNTDNQRIAKNSILLYLRTFLIMLVSLYTVRVTLNILGFEDYGIYNAIGGVVAVVAFLSNTLTSVSLRYFSFHLGKNNPTELKIYFNAVLTIYFVIAIIVALIAEILGYWLLNNYLTIPSSRLTAAFWVYHFSVFSLIVNFIQIPYNSIIIARERMDVFAYLSIVEVLLKLAVVFILRYVNYDSLILYSILLFVVAVLKWLFYYVYSSINFEETKFCIVRDISIYKELGKYLGWNTFGVCSAVVKTQGLVVILNVFFGPIVNAAYAIAHQINSAVNQFVSSFLLAVQPQIVKKYAEGEVQRMFTLIYRASKYSFFLLMIVAIPCILELPLILRLWLTEYPDYTVGFSIILIICALVDSLCIPLVTSIQATGKIKSYNIVISLAFLAFVPICIIAIKMGADAYSTLIISFVVTVLAQVVRVRYVIKLLNMPLKDYLKEVILKLIIVMTLSIMAPYLLSLLLSDSIVRLVIITITSVILSSALIFSLGMSEEERRSIKKFLNTYRNGQRD